jgi:hypothetical protein
MCGEPSTREARSGSVPVSSVSFSDPFAGRNAIHIYLNDGGCIGGLRPA